MAPSGDSPVWLLTGCSSGFGYALAHLAASKGARVIATSRNPKKTPELVKNIEALGGKWESLDVTASEADLTAKVKQLESIFGRIDVLVNNAGYSVLGSVEDLSTERAHEQMNVCFFGPLLLTRLILPGMRTRKTGVILNISSVAGLSPLPCCGLYAASKHALEGFTESLAAEVEPFGIRVHLVEPGIFRTNFLSAQSEGKVGGSVIIESSEPYKKGPVQDVMDKFESLNGKQAGDVQKAIDVMWQAVTAQGDIGKTIKDKKLLRIILGEDCVDRVKNKIADLQKTVDEEPWASKLAIDE